MEIDDIIISTIDKNTKLLTDFAPTLLAGVIVLIATFYFGKIFNMIIIKLSKKYHSSKPYANLFLKISKIFFTFIGIILFLNILGFKGLSTGVFASGGVVTIILGFTLREIGENFCAGVLLSINKPFRIGDTIRSLEFEGEVRSIEIRYTHIRSIDGKDIYIPSAQIYKNTLINYTKDGLQRFYFTIGIDYSSDLEKACKIIDQELENVNGILKDPKSGCIVNNLLPGYIEITVYFWMDIKKDFTIKQVRQDAVVRIKDALITERFILSNDTVSNYNVNISHENKNKSI